VTDEPTPSPEDHPAPPAYGAPPGQHPYAAWPPPTYPVTSAARPSRALAVWGFVLGLLGMCGITALASLVVSIIALVRVRSGRASGKGLAIAGLVLGSLWVVVFAVVTVVAVVFSTSFAHRSDDGTITSAGRVFLGDLRPGDCLDRMNQSGVVRIVHAVPCDDQHVAEVFNTFTLADGPFPGQDLVDQQARSGCTAAFQGYPAGPTDGFRVVFFRPLRSNWAGGRRVVCLAVALQGTTTGSLAESPGGPTV
jgi:Domain of unknown function (DUF4190)/Septum formation